MQQTIFPLSGVDIIIPGSHFGKRIAIFKEAGVVDPINFSTRLLMYFIDSGRKKTMHDLYINQHTF